MRPVRRNVKKSVSSTIQRARSNTAGSHRSSQRPFGIIHWGETFPPQYFSTSWPVAEASSASTWARSSIQRSAGRSGFPSSVSAATVQAVQS